MKNPIHTSAFNPNFHSGDLDPDMLESSIRRTVMTLRRMLRCSILFTASILFGACVIMGLMVFFHY